MRREYLSERPISAVVCVSVCVSVCPVGGTKIVCRRISTVVTTYALLTTGAARLYLLCVNPCFLDAPKIKILRRFLSDGISLKVFGLPPDFFRRKKVDGRKSDRANSLQVFILNE